MVVMVGKMVAKLVSDRTRTMPAFSVGKTEPSHFFFLFLIHCRLQRRSSKGSLKYQIHVKQRKECSLMNTSRGSMPSCSGLRVQLMQELQPVPGRVSTYRPRYLPVTHDVATM